MELEMNLSTIIDDVDFDYLTYKLYKNGLNIS